MAEPYKRLRDENNIQSSSIDVDQINSFLAQAASGKVSRRLKMYNAMVLLSFAQTAMALLIFLLGVTCSVLKDSRRESCFFGTAVWVGLLCLVSGGLGVVALRVPEGRKGFLLAYLVLSIFASIADGVLMIFSSIWISMNTFDLGRAYNKSVIAISLNAILLVVAFAHMIITIISKAFICYNWSCCDKKPGVVIFYVPQTVGTSGGHPENIQFLPPEGGVTDGTKPVIA